MSFTSAWCPVAAKPEDIAKASDVSSSTSLNQTCYSVSLAFPPLHHVFVLCSGACYHRYPGHEARGSAWLSSTAILSPLKQKLLYVLASLWSSAIDLKVPTAGHYIYSHSILSWWNQVPKHSGVLESMSFLLSCLTSPAIFIMVVINTTPSPTVGDCSLCCRGYIILFSLCLLY